jgi:DNA-directed RNA polymerase specialized sigma24 family protein
MSGWWSGHKVLDPTELESRFSTEDSWAFMDAVVNDSVSDEGALKIERVRDVMTQIPPREADFIDLYFFKQVKQTDIAAIFGVSQPTVCYRLQRAASRIQYLLSVPDITPEQMRQDITPWLADPVDVQVMVLMQMTTCQSEVAKELGVSQGFVRHRFLRSLDKLRKVEGLEVHVRLFELVANNLNILREVQRPEWDVKLTHVLL